MNNYKFDQFDISFNKLLFSSLIVLLIFKSETPLRTFPPLIRHSVAGVTVFTLFC